MRTGMHLSIQDYFKRSGLQRIRTAGPKGALPVQDSGPGPFAKALLAAHAAPPVSGKGMSIRDYLERPVHVRRSMKTGPIGKNFRMATHGRPAAVTPVQTGSTTPPIPTATPRILQNRDQGQPSIAGAERSRIQAGIEKAAARYELPPALIEAVIKAESDYDVRAVSPSGAQGLMQLMPATAYEMGVQNPFDVDQNIHGGARYLRNMLDRFNGDLHLALSAYNAGPGTVARFNGDVPYPETQNYLKRVMKYARQLSGDTKGIS